MSTGLEARIGLTRPEGFVVDISIKAPSGVTTALLGPNGSGKSTAIEAIAGLVELSHGTIEVDGRIYSDPAAGIFVSPEDREIGVVFQDYVLFPHLTIAENVAFGLRSRGVPRNLATERSLAWLERMDLVGLGGRRPSALSGGQAQRVALARALITDPRILLLDEPLSALDVTTRVQLRRTLQQHLETFPGPRLFVTHDPTEAFLLADRVYIMEDGRVTQFGTADEIRLMPRTRYAADLAGSNLVRGNARGGIIDVGGHPLHVADSQLDGAAIATVHPRAISLHTERPAGSPRNTWLTTITYVEHHGDRVRVQTGAPLPLTAEVTPAAIAALRLHEGSAVWVAIKATEIATAPV